MRPGLRGARNTSFATMLAGWLFADLLLVLFLIGLGSVPSAPTAEPTPTPTPTASPTPTPTPTPTPEAPLGLERTPVTLTVRVNAWELLNPATRPGAATEIQRQIAEEAQRAGFRDVTAGMVLIWGFAPDVNDGIQIAEVVGGELAGANPEVFQNATHRAFWKGGPTGKVDLEVYLLSA